MKLLCLSPVPRSGAGTRYRLLQYFPALRRAGVEPVLAPFSSERSFPTVFQPGIPPRKLAYFMADSVRRLAIVLRARRFDGVLLYREAFPFGPAFLEHMLSRLGVPIVYDFDDAIFLSHFSQANRTTAVLKRPQNVASIIRISREVMAGNRFLSRYAQGFHEKVTTVPTVVDSDYLTPAPPRRERNIVIGWIGTETTEEHFATLMPVIARVRERYPAVRFRLVAGRSSQVFPGVERRVWALDREVADLQEFDIGVMPLPLDSWSEGKCGLKALQYMSVARPVVCSPTGANVDIVGHEAGFLAATEAEWEEALSALIEDSSLRCRFGQAGRARVEEHYSLKRWESTVVETICRAISG